MASLWKIYYETRVVEGRSREEWDAAPATGVQVLAVKCPDGPDGLLSDVDTGERRKRSRVVYYQTERNRQLYSDDEFYIWGPDGKPAGCTPDAVLDAWALKTGETDVRVGDLTLDDLHAIGVKCGRSVENDSFERILRRAIDDPEIP